MARTAKIAHSVYQRVPIVFLNFVILTIHSFSQVSEFKPVSTHPLYVGNINHKQPTFLYKENFLFNIFRSDTIKYYNNELPYNGSDTLLTEDYLGDSKDTFLCVIAFQNGYKMKVVEYYLPSNEKYREINFEKGLLHGDYSKWYKNGKKLMTSFYYKGNIVGPMSWFYENGNIRECGIPAYTKGEEAATIFYWYEDGKVSGVLLPICGGKEHAVEEIKFHKDGSIKEKVIGNNGKQLWEAYFENGQKLFEAYIVDAPWAPIGRWVWWYENGQKKEERFYKDGETQAESNYRIGTWSWWDENGNLIKQEIYKDNKLIETKEFLPKAEKKSGE